MVSLLSVWMLVGLFYYLNRYTRREYFTVWTAAWLFYALWLTLGLKVQDVRRMRTASSSSSSNVACPFPRSFFCGAACVF